ASAAGSARERTERSSGSSRKPALAALVVLDVAIALRALAAAHAEVEFAHVLVADEAFGRPVEHDLAGLHDVAVMGDGEGNGRVLLDQQHGDAGFAVDAGDDAENLLDQDGGEAERGLV